MKHIASANTSCTTNDFGMRSGQSPENNYSDTAALFDKVNPSTERNQAMKTTRFCKMESQPAPTQCRTNPSKATARIFTALLLALAIPHQLYAAGPAPLNLLSNTNFVILAETTITT